MLQNSFQEQLEDCPVIAAARDREGLARCCQSESSIVFILFGDVCTISEIVDRVKFAGKLAFVHMDLVNGLSSREISVDYIRKEMRMESFPQNSHRSAVEKNLGYTPCTVFLLLIPQPMRMWKNVQKRFVRIVWN